MTNSKQPDPSAQAMEKASEIMSGHWVAWTQDGESDGNNTPYIEQEIARAIDQAREEGAKRYGSYIGEQLERFEVIFAEQEKESALQRAQLKAWAERWEAARIATYDDESCETCLGWNEGSAECPACLGAETERAAIERAHPIPTEIDSD